MTVDIQFHVNSYNLLKRLFESMIEGSTVAKLSFCNQSKYPLVIELIDSLWICNNVFNIEATGMSRRTIAQPCSFLINIISLHDFVRKSRRSKRIGIGMNKEKQLVVYNEGKSKALELTTDAAPYDTVRFIPYRHWPCISMTSSEFSQTILEYTVICTEIRFTLGPDGILHMYSGCDMGDIMYDFYPSHENPLYTCVTAPTQTVECKVITKFLKLVCSVAFLDDMVRLYLSPGGLVVEINQENQVSYQFFIQPFRGTRGKVIPPEYVQYAIRME